MPFLSETIAIWMVGSGYWLSIVLAVIAIVLMCALVCARKLSRKVPLNYLLLLTFTLCFGYCVGAVCALYYDEKEIVMTAAGMTAGIV
eukprot:CAMPEP_0202975544 /NCGR_PEP_ID=MMETSP1396-20130829/69959_1 /ASSEMBLY_ACC=CAM_ASM_000872 /TAXON_ID= /ORGANISM="Pseudokeronopsis sp., Strain Brazil" /LENGTH=87 /DNA_ID=CAMNT_0049711315 /DNA_START=32 /DNA_END=291 /DNA_ORIENTATION=+